MGRDYYTFKVKACKDVRIKLSTRFGVTDTNTYEIIVGADNNQKTEIIPDPESSHKESANTADVLDCDTYTPLWVAWRYGTLRVGSSAYVWENELLSYTDSNPSEINAVWMETASDTDGIFSVTDLESEYLTDESVYTPASSARTTSCALTQYCFIAECCREWTRNEAYISTDQYNLRPWFYHRR